MLKKSTISIAAVLILTGPFGRADEPAQLRYSPECILATVAKKMEVNLSADIPLPEIRYERDVTLEEFQRAVQGQWTPPPDVITNVYSFSQNVIYLIDDPGYYRRLRRFIDDSLFHEYVHYIQVKYKHGLPLSDFDEHDAVHLQNWFRDTYMKTGENPCAD